MSRTLPGLVLAMTLAVLARWIHTLPFPPFTIEGRHPVDTYLLAVLLGLACRNLLPLGQWPQRGAQVAVKRLLPIAIVLLGARLDFQRVMALSARGLILSVSCLLIAFAITLWLCARLRVPRRLSLLIGIGTAICGGTAVAVAAPVVEAEEQETAYALGVITLVGLIALFVFPLIGHALAMSESQFGLWAGAAIHSTPQVMAAGFSYGPLAGEVAVVVKLTRVLLLAPSLVFVSLWYARSRQREGKLYFSESLSWKSLFPPFILGFLLLAIANSLSLLPTITLSFPAGPLSVGGVYEANFSVIAKQLSGFLAASAMVGVGLSVRLERIARIGPRGLYVGCLAAVILSAVSLAFIKLSH
ncbi:MAG: putative sulfate exporter family transporter [Myxococcota bacterium]|nr:putative sulfate exporter family transporter [Myxococcota bacterium]